MLQCQMHICSNAKCTYAQMPNAHMLKCQMYICSNAKCTYAQVQTCTYKFRHNECRNTNAVANGNNGAEVLTVGDFCIRNANPPSTNKNTTTTSTRRIPNAKLQTPKHSNQRAKANASALASTYANIDTDLNGHSNSDTQYGRPKPKTEIPFPNPQMPINCMPIACQLHANCMPINCMPIAAK